MCYLIADILDKNAIDGLKGDKHRWCGIRKAAATVPPVEQIADRSTSCHDDPEFLVRRIQVEVAIAKQLYV